MNFEHHQQMSPEIELSPEDVFKYRSLRLLSRQLREYTPEGYPTADERLTLASAAEPEIDKSDPAWEVGEQQSTIEEQQSIATSGYRLDSRGRPLHPWLDEMLVDSSIGVTAGKGCFYEWGANFTADSVIMQDGYVLLVLRKDTRTWALPGGFADRDDDGQYEPLMRTAIREPEEEAGIDLRVWPEPTLLYQGPVADPRMTAHAWPETSAYCFQRGGDGSPLPFVQGGDDAKRAAWFPLELAQRTRLYGSHNLLIELACQRLEVDPVSETAFPR